MCDDRTAEFLSLARNLPDQDRLQARPTSITSSGQGGIVSTSSASTTLSSKTMPSSSSSNPMYNELRSFHKTAGDISKDIAATSAMLSELTQLVRQTSLFVDDSDRVNYLVVRIKSNIENLNGRLDQANLVIQQQKRKLGKNSQASQEASNLVGQLKEEFVQATVGFKAVLQQRTDGMKERTDQKRLVYGGSSSEELGSGAGATRNNSSHDPSLVSLENKPPVYGGSSSSSDHGHHHNHNSAASMMSASQGGAAAFPTLDLTSGYHMSPGESSSSASQLPRPYGARGEGGGSAGMMRSPADMRFGRSSSDVMPTFSGSSSSYYGHGGGGGPSSAPLTPLDIARMEQESGQDQMMQLIPDQTYLRERADAMETVESNIAALGTIFNKLAVMVSEHREMVQRVEDNVDDAHTNISLSMETLTDTLTNLRTNRALFMKVFSVIVVFIILFITFFA